MASIDQQFIEYIVKTLVNNPDDVVVERSVDEKGVLLTLTVNPEDLGRVIGRRGMTAQSLRTLLRALGTKNDARYNLKIVNNDGRGEGAEEVASIAVAAPVSTETVAPVPAVEETPEETVEKSDNSGELAEKTRAELAELDDLDI